MSDDIRHIDKNIRKIRADADAAEKIALVEQQRSIEYRSSGNEGRMQFHEAEAVRQNRRAADLKAEAAEHEAAMHQVQGEIASLEQQRDELIRAHEHDVDQLNKQIERLKGSSLTF